MADFVNTEDEPTAPAPITLNVDDNTKYSATSYRDRTYKEISQWKRARLRQRQARKAAAAAPGGPAAPHAASATRGRRSKAKVVPASAAAALPAATTSRPGPPGAR